jgi:hypothetical protein
VNGKRDYKTPVKNKILDMAYIPETFQSNITGKERQTPSDVFDACGIAYGWLKKLEGGEGKPYFRSIKFAELKINPHNGYDLKGDM